MSAHCTFYTIPVFQWYTSFKKNSSSYFEADIPHEDQNPLRTATRAQRGENGKIVLTTPLLQLVTPKTLGRIKKDKCEGSIAEKPKEADERKWISV